MYAHLGCRWWQGRTISAEERGGHGCSLPPKLTSSPTLLEPVLLPLSVPRRFFFFWQSTDFGTTKTSGGGGSTQARLWFPPGNAPKKAAGRGFNLFCFGYIVFAAFGHKRGSWSYHVVQWGLKQSVVEFRTPPQKKIQPSANTPFPLAYDI